MKKQISHPTYQGNTTISWVSVVPDTECVQSEIENHECAFMMEDAYPSAKSDQGYLKVSFSSNQWKSQEAEGYTEDKETWAVIWKGN